MRHSIASRCRQARLAFPAMVLNSGLTVPLLGRGISAVGLAMWLLAITGLLLARYLVGRHAQRHIEDADAPLERYDHVFRSISILSQTVTGAGIWLVLGHSDDVAAYVMTLLGVLYAVGTMVNLAHDYPSVRLSLPLLMGQLVLYWLMRDLQGFLIAAYMVGLLVLMLSAARSSQRTFDESIAVQFEKDDLLRQLEREKRSTEDALTQAENANRAKSFFMAAASHDLRQPLYAASILRDVIAMQKLEPPARRLVEQQGHALAAAGSLFDNLLDLSKFDSGVVIAVPGAVRLAEVFAQIATEFTPQCELRKIAMTVSETDATVITDADLMIRMLRNLVSNAVRYTESGGVAVTATPVGNETCVRVADTGIGIAADDRERVFQEFVQIENPARARDKGVGLGLAIVRHIAKLLDARLNLISEVGQGTTVEFYLPTTQPRSMAAIQEPFVTVDLMPWAGCCVWVVDDDPLVRHALQSFFEQLHAMVLPLSSAAAARHAIEERPAPDYVILDDMLGSGESGLSLAQWMKERLPQDRILLTTGNTLEERQKELRASGFRVERKPVTAETLRRWGAATFRNS